METQKLTTPPLSGVIVTEFPLALQPPVINPIAIENPGANLETNESSDPVSHASVFEILNNPLPKLANATPIAFHWFPVAKLHDPIVELVIVSLLLRPWKSGLTYNAPTIELSITTS